MLPPLRQVDAHYPYENPCIPIFCGSAGDPQHRLWARYRRTSGSGWPQTSGSPTSGTKGVAQSPFRDDTPGFLRQTQHSHGSRRVGGRRVTELAMGVATPAVDGASGEEGAGLFTTSGDGRDPAESAHRHRGRVVGRGPVPKLANNIVTPAVNGPSGEEDTVVQVARGNGSRPADSVHIYRSRGGITRAVPELAK